MNSKPLIITPDVAMGFMRGFDLVPPLHRYESIEDKAAEMLATSEVQLDLDGVAEISVQAINYLVQRQDDLCLGIPEITNDQARALKGLRKNLSLNNLKEISLSALEILVSTPRELLALDGLMTLTPEHANFLACFQGNLSLGGLSRMDGEVAKYLARHVGSLSIKNLKALTTEESRHLTHHQGSVVLSATLHVPREGAYLLRKHFGLQVEAYSVECFVEDCLVDGTDHAIAMARNSIKTVANTLCLDGLNVLQRGGAEVLAEFPGELQLPALAELDPAVAMFLSKHNGKSLALDGLISLTVPVTAALGKHRGALFLRGATSFDEGSPSLLAHHDGSLMLPLPDGGNDKFGWFKVEDKTVFNEKLGWWIKEVDRTLSWKPSGIDHHDLAVVGEILQSHSLEIEIPEEVHFVSNTVLARLGYACRRLGKWISVPGLLQIDQDQCQLLIGCHIGKPYASETGHLSLDGVIELSPQVAKELGKSGLCLSLSSLTKISSGILQCLTQDIKDLKLNGLETISEEGCRYLATVPGQLLLDGVKRLPSGCAAALSRHKGRLALNGVHAVSDSEATELSQHDGTVELKGIRATKMNSSLLTGFIEGALVLDELEIFYLIRGFAANHSSKRANNSGTCVEGLGTADSSMPELVARLLIEHLSRCLDFAARSLASRDPSFLMGNASAAECQVFAVLASHRRNPPKMDIDDLISYVTEKYGNREILSEGDEHSLPLLEQREKFDRCERRQKIFEKICNIAGNSPNYHDYGRGLYYPDLKPITEAYLRTAKRIMVSGLTGESDISCATLVILGCLFGKRVELPEVDRLCPNGAKALSMLEAEIELNGIKKLTPEIALLLSQHEGYAEMNYDYGNEREQYIYHGSLHLNGIDYLDVNTAAALALHRGDTLCLNGLSFISDAVADALSQYKESQMGDVRHLELHGLRVLTPRAAQSLSGCLDQDPWTHVDGEQVKARFMDAMLDWQTEEVDHVDCVLNAFIDLAILLSHQNKAGELEDLYLALLNSLEIRLGKASKAWVSCVVLAARARTNSKLSCTELILQETMPVIESLIINTAAEEEQDLRFIEWVAEAGELKVADSLMGKMRNRHPSSQLIMDSTTPHFYLDNLSGPNGDSSIRRIAIGSLNRDFEVGNFKDKAEFGGLPQVLSQKKNPELVMDSRKLAHIQTSDNSLTHVRCAGEEKIFEIAPGVWIVMCWIPPGAFLMGCPAREIGNWDNEGQPRVTITQGFWLGKYQISQAEWEAVMGKNPSYFRDSQLPVETVSWDDISKPEGFLERIKRHDSAGGVFALPTEAQWEYACRSSTKTALNNGMGLTSLNGPCPSLNEIAWYSRNSGQKPHLVGQKIPNEWGIHDMHGNVWEWCSDYYAGYPEGPLVDPSGPDSGLFRITRGGSWSSDAHYCRAARRGIDVHCCRSNNIGFRLARSVVS